MAALIVAIGLAWLLWDLAGAPQTAQAPVEQHPAEQGSEEPLDRPVGEAPRPQVRLGARRVLAAPQDFLASPDPTLKAINDNFGHHTGDQMIKGVTKEGKASYDSPDKLLGSSRFEQVFQDLDAATRVRFVEQHDPEPEDPPPRPPRQLPGA